MCSKIQVVSAFKNLTTYVIFYTKNGLLESLEKLFGSRWRIPRWQVLFISPLYKIINKSSLLYTIVMLSEK